MNRGKVLVTILILILIVHPITGNNTSYNQTTKLPIIIKNETDIITINVNASDPDKEDTLQYFFSQPFDDAGNWQTGYEDAGEYVINVTVSDGEYADHTQLKVIVFEKDRPPIITATGEQTINENEELILTIEAFDPDGDNVTLNSLDIPKNAIFVNNTLYWQPGYDLIEKTWIRKILAKLRLDILKDNKFFTATINAKGKDLNSTEIVSIKVIDVNRPPKIQPIENITISEGEVLNLAPKATDPDNDFIVFYYSDWVSHNNYQTTYNDEGTHLVKVIASDGYLSDYSIVYVNVENTNRPPELDKIKTFKIDEGANLTFDVDAFDSDNDELTFDIRPLPEGATFANHTFAWTPNFNIVTKEEQTKTFVVNVTTYDGKNSDIKTTNITVNNINRAPEIFNASPIIEDFTVYVGDAVVFEINALDPDNDELNYRWNFGLFSSYENSSIHKRVFMRTGHKEVIVKAFDGIKSVEKTWTFNVIKQETPQPEEQTEVEETQETGYITFTI